MKRRHELLDRRRVAIRQVRGVIALLSESPPIELHKRMLLRYFLDHLIGYTRALPEPRQMQLLHFLAAAHIVHQVERIPFAANKRHDLTSPRARFNPRSVTSFHYALQY